jgi:hypothetical protein
LQGAAELEVVFSFADQVCSLVNEAVVASDRTADIALGAEPRIGLEVDRSGATSTSEDFLGLLQTICSQTVREMRSEWSATSGGSQLPIAASTKSIVQSQGPNGAPVLLVPPVPTSRCFRFVTLDTFDHAFTRIGRHAGSLMTVNNVLVSAIGGLGDASPRHRQLFTADFGYTTESVAGVVVDSFSTTTHPRYLVGANQACFVPPFAVDLRQLNALVRLYIDAFTVMVPTLTRGSEIMSRYIDGLNIIARTSRLEGEGADAAEVKRS